jgi:hypothetical protein
VPREHRRRARRGDEEEGARDRFRVDEPASSAAMHRLAREKSLRKSAQSGLCDAKTDAPWDFFF